jgi:hypothetical protein
MMASRIRRSAGGAGIWYLAATAFGIAFAALALQQLSGILGQREIDIGNHSDRIGLRKFSARGGHYGGLIPDRYRTDLVTRSAVVLEDGRPLPHRQTSIRSVDGGFGRFTISAKYAHFRPNDGGDPNTNGHRYTLRVPRPVKSRNLWGLFAGCVLCLGVAQRRPSATVPPFIVRAHKTLRRRPWLEFALVTILAMLGALWASERYADLSNGGLCVMGKPYSDAIGWNEVAANLNAGLGFEGAFSNNRPFYPLLQSMVFLVGGESLAVAQATNVFLIALGAVFVYYATRRLFPPPVAAGTFAFVLVSPEYQMMAPTLLTELPAYAVGAIGLYLLALGCAPGDSRRRPWLLLLAGMFLGLSNLSRPFTLLALPLAGLAVLYAGLSSRWGWRKTFLRGCILGAGIVLVFFPWALRQKRVTDSWSISINSSELLYGAAMPDGGGKWNPRQFEEAETAGVSSQDPIALARFFSKRYRETVGADPAAYAGRMMENYVHYLRTLSLENIAAESILALTVLTVLGAASWRSRSILPLLGFPLFWILGRWADGWRGYELVPCALAVLLLWGGKRTWLGALIAFVFIAASGVLSALVGNLGFRRGFPILEWLFISLLIASAVVLANVWSRNVLALSHRFLRSRSRPLPADSPMADEGRAPLAMALSFLGFIVVGGLAVCGRSLFVGDAPPKGLSLEDAVRAKAIELTCLEEPSLRDLPPEEIYCEVVRVGDLRWKIPGHYDAGHWSRLFELRPGSRTTAYFYPGVHRRPGVGLVGAHFHGKLEGIDSHDPYVLVGIRNLDANGTLGHDPLVIEGLALIPYDPTQARLLANARFFPPGQAALDILPAGYRD